VAEAATDTTPAPWPESALSGDTGS
jgi:hypothetical protein